MSLHSRGRAEESRWPQRQNEETEAGGGGPALRMIQARTGAEISASLRRRSRIFTCSRSISSPSWLFIKKGKVVTSDWRKPADTAWPSPGGGGRQHL